MNQHVKYLYLGQGSFSLKVIVQTHRHTHIDPIALPGPLKWSVINMKIHILLCVYVRMYVHIIININLLVFATAESSKGKERQLYLSIKATPVERDMTWLCSVIDDDLHAAQLRQQTFSGRPDAVDRRQLNAVHVQMDLGVTKYRSDERRDRVFCLVDTDLLISQRMLGF